MSDPIEALAADLRRTKWKGLVRSIHTKDNLSLWSGGLGVDTGPAIELRFTDELAWRVPPRTFALRSGAPKLKIVICAPKALLRAVFVNNKNTADAMLMQPADMADPKSLDLLASGLALVGFQYEPARGLK